VIRRLSCVTLLAPAIAALVVPNSAAAAGFSLGVASGEVTSSSAQVWARAPKAGPATAQVSTSRRFGRGTVSRRATATSAGDLTLNAKLTHLRPATRYFYRWVQGAKRSKLGRFETAPKPGDAKTVRFAWSGDADAQPARGQTTPFYNSLGDHSFAVYRAMAKEGNDFNVNLGDTIYSDSEVGATFTGGVYQGFAPALTLADKQAKYRQNIALPNLQLLRGSTGLYSQPDDHEWINDFSRFEQLSYTDAAGMSHFISGQALYPIGVRAFRDYAPVSYTSKLGFYRVFHWGKNLDVFILDERSFRSAKAGSPAIHTCDNPQTGTPDLAPTAPADTRSLFALALPALSSPVAPACTAAIDSPTRTMLGAAQEAAFFKAIKGSKATFKVIMNEVPIQQFYALPYDRWEGYEADRERVVHFLQANVKNSIFLTTDDHGNLVNTIRYKTFPSEGGPLDSGIEDVTTGPVATMTFQREIDQATAPGDAALVDTLFFSRPPDQGGVGMQCSALNVFSYGEVTATSKKLTVALKDQNGNPVREEEGAKPACPQITLTAK
jgi:phosphodiesterase/alkaline phosphatase D-like protein